MNWQPDMTLLVSKITIVIALVSLQLPQGETEREAAGPGPSFSSQLADCYDGSSPELQSSSFPSPAVEEPMQLD